jgi:hypothetical protein
MIKELTLDVFKSVMTDYFPEEHPDLFEDIFEELGDEVQPVLTDSMQFLKLLKMYRKSRLHHRNISSPDPDSPQVSKVVDWANKFCKTHGLPKKQGYLKFIEIGTGLMRNYRFTAFTGLSEKIIEQYSLQVIIDEDLHPDISEAIGTMYTVKVLEKTGVGVNPTLEDKVHFITAAEYCVENGISPDNFINGMFQTLAWKNGIPSPAALASQKMFNLLPQYLKLEPEEQRDNEMVISLKKIREVRGD